MKRIICSLFLLFSVLLATSAQAAFNQLPLSFIQTAEAARITPIQGQVGYYELKLYNVSPYITYYGKRPHRITGLASLKDFVSSWKVGDNSYKKVNPNAVIYGAKLNLQLNRSREAYVVKISDPKYNENKREMTYVISPLGKQEFILKDFTLDYVMVVID